MKKKLILASSSPRRKEILEMVGLKFKIVQSNDPEKMNPRLGPKSQVEFLAEQKAAAVARKFVGKEVIILAADTVVVLKGEILGKPTSLADARKMLQKMNGKTHTVLTGFTIIDTKTKKKVTKCIETKVSMKKVSDLDIEKYVAKEYVLDAAGSYKIHQIGSVLFEKVEGDFFNIVGLPIQSVATELKKFGIDVFA